MRLLIDMLGCQASNANRGIGRYSISLVKEMIRQVDDNDIILLLSNAFPDTVDTLKTLFSDFVPEKNIRVYDALHNTSALNEDKYRSYSMALVREAIIAEIAPDVILITSLFEGSIDDSVISISSNLSDKIPTAVILYDLIPLVNKNIYLKNVEVEKWYFHQLEQLSGADLLLAISESSKQEAIDYLELSSEHIVNISSACDDHFKPTVITPDAWDYLSAHYGVKAPFILYTGGIDHRKNIDGLITAYSNLNEEIKKEYQLVIVCSILDSEKEILQNLGKSQGIKDGQLVFTGFIPEDDLVIFYNACDLFVFPSWHEGFGLPLLEAMSCGKAVIGSNSSSIPEVIGCNDMLFEPFNDMAISEKISRVIQDKQYRKKFEQHGLEQAKKFSWQVTAKRTWDALNRLSSDNDKSLLIANSVQNKKPRLAYISPLPPERSGISSYSVELLPHLSKYYEIDVVANQPEINDVWINSNCNVLTINEFRENAYLYERVLYHFGNSEFHSHMVELISDVPGIVVLHDYYLSGLITYMDVISPERPCFWINALLNGHGWNAVRERFSIVNEDPSELRFKYPCNQDILQKSLGVIVHSSYSKKLADDYYHSDVSKDWSLIPLLRGPAVRTDKAQVRKILGISENAFVVCSFGILGETKLNDRLLSAWLSSPLADNPDCYLVFVGKLDGSEHSKNLAQKISDNKVKSNVFITGWVEAEDYRNWLNAADAGVQLRTMSLGETSAAVLDCMNYGLATIANANGSMIDLPDHSVCLLPDKFSDQQLTDALVRLYHDDTYRMELSRNAEEVIHSFHQPDYCASQYTESIERFYNKAQQGMLGIIERLAKIPSTSENMIDVSRIISSNFLPKPRRKQLLVDISELVKIDAKSGIQRVVKAILKQLILNPPDGYDVQAVYVSPDHLGYRYARKFTCRFLNIHDGWVEDTLIETGPSDIFLGLDLQMISIPILKDFLLKLRQRGLKVHFVVYDLLPILLPKTFIDITESLYRQWIETVILFDGAICISHAVADELSEWMETYHPDKLAQFDINWFSLGGDIDSAIPTKGIPEDAKNLFRKMKSKPSFLTVGTIEPRKCHNQILHSFNQLWDQNIDVNLIIVGKRGWLTELLVRELENHPQLNDKLFWIECCSDEYLEKIYELSKCLIAASEGEGFGLPLMEAAKYQLPIIARDIPVFKEVAGNGALYFSGFEPENLSSVIKQWLELFSQNNVPKSDHISCTTWKQSSEQLLKVLLDKYEN